MPISLSILPTKLSMTMGTLYIDSFCSNIKKVIALIALILLLTLVILIFTHTSLGYFLVLLPITLLIIYLLHKIKELDEQESFFNENSEEWEENEGC